MVIYNDLLVVVGQILGQNAVKEDHMVAYLVKTQATTSGFRNIVFIKVPRAQNTKVDRLAKLASSSEVPNGVHIEYLEIKTIEVPYEVEVAPVQICRC